MGLPIVFSHTTIHHMKRLRVILHIVCLQLPHPKSLQTKRRRPVPENVRRVTICEQISFRTIQYPVPLILCCIWLPMNRICSCIMSAALYMLPLLQWSDNVMLICVKCTYCTYKIVNKLRLATWWLGIAGFVRHAAVDWLGRASIGAGDWSTRSCVTISD